MRTEWASAYGDRCLDNFTYIRAQGLASLFKARSDQISDGGYVPRLLLRRQASGGTGTPAHEVQAVVPSFEYGLPAVWVGLDEDDPPVFESEATYLKRHGLLLAGEK